MSEEIWRPCPDFVGLYEVSNLGRVRSLYSKPPLVIAQATDRTDYPMVALSRDGRRTSRTVHRLVCRAFHGEPFSIWNEAAHLDGDRANARADNLKWVNKVENHFHQRAHGTHMAGEKHPRAKLTQEEVNAIRGSAGPRGEIAARYGISKSTVTDIRTGRRWRPQ